MRKIVVFVTACILLVGALLGTASASDLESRAISANDLNFSESSSNASTMFLDEVLSDLLGHSVSQAEKDILRFKFSGLNVLSYTKADVVSPKVAYDGETGILTLTLKNDSYYTTTNKRVVWTPASVSLGDRTEAFVQAPDLGTGYYRAEFENVNWTPSVSFTIEYQTNIVLGEGTLNSFVNYAYQRAQSLDSEKQEYELKLIDYNQKLADYEANHAAWEKYETDMDAYDVYLERLALYQSYLAYQQYLTDLAVYEQELAAWRENVAQWQTYEQNKASYDAYVAYKTEYPGLKDEYDENSALVQHQLALLALLEQKDPVTGVSFVDRMIDDRMMEKIAEYKEELLMVPGIEEKTVDDATGAAEYLRHFCTTLKGLTTPEARYRYYIREYASFAQNLNRMYVSVSKLYKHETVYKTLTKLYPNDMYKLVRLLGSVYVYSCVFGDDLKLNMNMTIDSWNKTKAFDLVDASLVPASDTNQATPLTFWPVEPADPETYPVKTEPDEPAPKFDEPTEPTPVKNPGVDSMEAPQEVAEPIAPEQTLQHPGTAPSLAWDSYLTALHEAYLAGQITERPSYAASETVTLRSYGHHSASLSTDEQYFFVQFFDSDQSGTYLGTVAVQNGSAAVYDGTIPTKPSDVYNHFTFDCWVLADGTEADLSCITQDMNVYAKYSQTPRSYTVTWDVDGKQTEQQYTYGQTPVFEGSIDKASTAQYTYEFIGWNKQIVPVSGDVTYRAEYTATLNRYNVTFVVGDGPDDVKSHSYTYGYDLREVGYNLGTPFKPGTAQYTYTFAGWMDENGQYYANSDAFPTLTEDMTFTAQFDPIVNSYKVTWNVEGQLIEQTLAFGQMPQFVGVPQKQSTAQYHYEFVAWDQEPAAVQGDVTYTACFAEVLRSYEITFVVDDKTYSSVLDYGELPIFNGDIRKPDDVQYTYIFVSWDHEFLPVEGEATYTAQFDKILRKYPVTFVVNGEEITAEFDYGKVPVYPNSTPTRPDDSRYRYVFAGWDKEFVAVDGTEVTYTARFDAVALAPVPDGEGGELNIGSDGNFELQIPGTQTDISLIIDKAGAQGAGQLTVQFSDGKLIFDSTLINAFYNMGGGLAGVSLTPTEHEGRLAYEIKLLDEQGTPVAFLVSEVKVMLPYNGAGRPEVFHVNADGSLKQLAAVLENGYLTFEAMDFSVFVIKERFAVTSTDMQNGVVQVADSAHDGETVTFELDPDEGYHIDTVTVTCNGESIAVSLADGVYSFIMPKGDVQVSATFKVVEGGTGNEVMVGVITALLIVSIGIIIAIVLRRRKPAKA